VLLFPYGTDGFHLDIPTDVKAKSVTAMEYYCCQLAARWPGLKAVPAAGQRCRRLCENGTAAAKLAI